MKKIVVVVFLSFAFFCSFSQQLGVHFSPSSTVFRVWSPAATGVRLRLYATGEGGVALRTVDLNRGGSGIWEVAIEENLENQYYTFQTCQGEKWLEECPDIYAKAVGVNGKRGMIVNMGATDPAGWGQDRRPLQRNFTDIIIYELHIRDISVDPGSGIVHKGKFLGLAETGTRSPGGEPTGLDHIKQLGVTHVHLLPSFDFNSVDEAGVGRKGDAATPGRKYNWGYDPLNYNVPEGSYATDAYDGRVRIREFKQMVKTLHDNGLRVILDVVYNHTSGIEQSNFTQWAPGYFYRHKADSSYSNGTGCGNETASERAMMRKFMVESVAYWAKEYHLDGFRFDLMGVHDLVTMNAISDTLHKIDPTIFIYGEGWAAGRSPLPEEQRAVKKNMLKLDRVAAFSDDIRDGLRGGSRDVRSRGFVSGEPGMAESIKFGIVASIQHPQINYSLVNDSKAPWAAEPYQAITYVSCHDDNCLFDRLKISNPASSEADLIQMDKLANAIVLTSQGVPFLLAGEEMLRTKQGVANSYRSPDSVNELDWSRKTRYKEVFTYYQGMIALRKHHPAFRMPSADLIRQHLEFIDTHDPLVIAYELKDHANGDEWKNILILLNGSAITKTVTLPAGRWVVAADRDGVNEGGIGRRVGKVVVMPGTSAYVLFQR